MDTASGRSQGTDPSRAGVVTWAAVSVFWLFIALIYAGQILWLAQVPGERINVRAAISWQAAYFVSWIPFTVLVWHLTRPWVPDSSDGWPRVLLRHVPLFLATATAHLVVVTLCARALAGQTTSLWDGFLMQMPRSDASAAPHRHGGRRHGRGDDALPAVSRSS
jgi:hypothetical protein